MINERSLDIVELVLVEDIRLVTFPKILQHRLSTGKEVIFPRDSNMIVVAFAELVDTEELLRLDINRPGNAAIFTQQWMN